jgi:glycosyltransferase involved in cell wall biosynthesis
VLALYRAADLFVLASRIAADGDRDGLPNVVLEAASQRLAVISTRLPGITEFVRDGENGVAVEPGDPVALAAALERAICDPGLRTDLGTAAETAVRSGFDHRRSIRFLLALFADSGVARPAETPAP